MNTDPRQVRSRERIIEAATAVLREGGAAALTVESVAARSGVAKTTIYRQFAGRDEIHLEALRCLTTVAPIADTGALRADVETWMRQFALALRDGDFATLIPSAIEAAERSSRMRELVNEMITARRLPMLHRLRTAQGTGALRADVNTEVLATLLVAPLFEHRYISGRAMTRTTVARIIDLVLTPLLTT